MPGRGVVGQNGEPETPLVSKSAPGEYNQERVQLSSLGPDRCADESAQLGGCRVNCSFTFSISHSRDGSWGEGGAFAARTLATRKVGVLELVCMNRNTTMPPKPKNTLAKKAELKEMDQIE